MSTSASVASPFQSPTSAATEEQALQFLILQRLMRVQTSIVVQIKAVHGGGLAPVGTVDVLPLVNQVDGAGNAVPHVTIYGRPYLRWQGGANAVILDPVIGDLGLMVFCSRDISAVIASKQASPPASGRIFAYADGLYVGGALNAEPTSYLQWLADGTLNLVSPTTINIQAPNINITGAVNANGAAITEAGEITDALGIALGTHLHTLVQTGTSDTGPPTP